MAAATGASEFLDRNSEREHLDTLLADVREGHSAGGSPGEALHSQIATTQRIAGVAS